MKELVNKSMNIMFNKMYNLVKLNKYSEKEIIEILCKDIKFLNASLVVSVSFAINYEINKALEEYKKVIK